MTRRTKVLCGGDIRFGMNAVEPSDPTTQGSELLGSACDGQRPNYWSRLVRVMLLAITVVSVLVAHEATAAIEDIVCRQW